MPNQQKYSNIIIGILCILLYLYVLLRAHFLNITHDEAYSFHNVKIFWYAEFFCTGNSHWLNSLAIKCALLLGLENVLALRWLSILSFAIVLICIFIWIKTIEQPYLKLAAFCFTLLNPYLIDYFGLARGYASGLMFQAIAGLFFIYGLSSGKRNILLCSLIFSGLSAVANFGFVYFFMAFSLIYFYKIHFKDRFSFLKQKIFYVDIFIVLIFCFIQLRAFIFIIHCSNDLIGAGVYSIGEMFRVFIDGLTYHKIELIPAHLQLFTLLFLALILIASIFGILKNKTVPLYFYCSALLLIMLALIIFNRFCFDLVFPFNRSMLVFFIPVSICLFYFIGSVLKNNFFKKIIFSSISVFLIFNFLLSLNLKYCLDYKESADSQESFDLLTDIGAKRVGISPELYGVYSNYYAISKNYTYTYIGEMIETRLPKGTSPQKNKLSEYDHLIIFPPYDLSYYKNSNIKVKVLKYYQTTRLVLVKVE